MFFIQIVNLERGEQEIKGIEYIGYDQDSQSLKSHCFENNSNLLEDTVGRWKWPGGGYESTMTRIEWTHKRQEAL